MITLHFHLIPQYKYELFHIYFTWFHCTGRNELNKLTLLPMCGFIAQLVEHRTGIAEVMGSNPVEALIFFRLLLSSCLNWKIHCDDHTSLSTFKLESKNALLLVVVSNHSAFKWPCTTLYLPLSNLAASEIRQIYQIKYGKFVPGAFIILICNKLWIPAHTSRFLEYGLNFKAIILFL